MAAENWSDYADRILPLAPLPEAVDLGLSVKWASFNLGASAPEGYGNNYAWGEIETKNDYSWETYKWCNGSETSLTKYNSNSLYGTVDNKMTLDLEDDVAHNKLGGAWRMPTNEEWKELEDNCSWTWTNQNGRYGRLVTAPNGNSIFLPIVANISGDYWASSRVKDYPYNAWLVRIDSTSFYRYSTGRDHGCAIRPVCP